MNPANPVDWPGWSAQKTLVLPIAPERWAPPTAPVMIDGLAFAPKSELHVTLVARGLGQSLHGDSGRRRLRMKTVREAFGQLDWNFNRTGEMLRLEKRELAGHGRGRAIGAIVERIEMPAMAAFHAALAELLGRELAIPPAHVTLYTTGRTQGIAIPDAATLQRLIVREVAAAELAHATAAAEKTSSSQPSAHHRAEHRNPSWR